MGKLKALSKNEELGDIPTHFMKSGSSMPPQDRLNTLLEFQRRVLPKKYKGLDVEYDIWYNTNELNTIRTWLYTDFIGQGIYLRVNTVKINDRLLDNIVADPEQKIDEDRIAKITKGLSDKYTLGGMEETYDKVAFPPGSNLLSKNIINWKRLGELVEEGFVIKPHPITAHVFIAKMKHRFGRDKVLNKMSGGHEILAACKELAFCPNSEMGMTGLLLGKKIHSFAIPRTAREKNHLTYESIYHAIQGQQSSTLALKKILSSPRAGIVFPFDPDAEDRVQRYFDNFWEMTFRT